MFVTEALLLPSLVALDFLKKVVLADDYWCVYSEQLVELLKSQIQLRLPFLAFELFIAMMNELYGQSTGQRLSRCRSGNLVIGTYVGIAEPRLAAQAVDSILKELLVAFLDGLQEKTAKVAANGDRIRFYADALFSLDALVDAIGDWSVWPQLDERPFSAALDRIADMKAELLLRVFRTFSSDLHALLDAYCCAG